MELTTIDVTRLNQQGYLDIRYIAAKGATIVSTSIGGDEFTLAGSALNTVVLSGAPVFQADDVYRYIFTGMFVPGTVLVNFVAGLAGQRG